MRITLVLSILIFIPNFAQPQSFLHQVSASSASTGYADIASVYSKSISGNPAIISNFKEASLLSGFAYRFNHPSFSTMSAGVVMPVASPIRVSLLAARFGDRAFHEQAVSLSVCHQVGETYLGLSLNVMEEGGEQLLTERSATIDIGVALPLLSSLRLGAMVKNILRTAYRYEENSIPTYIQTGIAYEPLSDKLELQLVISKEVAGEKALHAGVFYKPIPEISLQTGVRTYPLSQHFGIGCKLNKVSVHYVIERSQYLPVNHLLGMYVQLSKKAAI
ncbi:hypothetical protein V6R21_12725 [Limibacter armeniacum]|uniref:hypothetical protein n=1 Tax=Limibacter armeniacum TaxID=466084 RepID=UPI002FE5566E